MERKIFTSEKVLQEGDKDESVANVREYLDRLGYLPPGAAAPMEALTELDSGLSEAIKKYQQFHGLEASGMIDEETRRVMEMPRCGVADLRAGEEVPGVAAFVASGGKWPTNTVTYRFVSGTDDLAGDTERDIVRQALGVWAAVTPLTFTEVSGTAAADILISWVSGDHGDGSPFDGPGHVLAHAFFPPPINPHPGIAGDTHFDDAETWATTHGGGNIDLLTVAIHEIGHALGLRHSTVSAAIMFPTYSGIKRTLDADDIQGMQSIYPAPAPPPELSFFQRLIRWIRRLLGLS